jgi:hypothetical protein
MAVVYHRFVRRRDQNFRRKRVFKDVDNPIDYLDDNDIIAKYRLPRYLIFDLCRRFDGDLKRPTLRSRSLSVSLQVMTALRFYATGSFQEVTADVHRISRSSVSRVIQDVTNCLVRISREHIKIPTQQELGQVMTRLKLAAINSSH